MKSSAPLLLAWPNPATTCGGTPAALICGTRLLEERRQPKIVPTIASATEPPIWRKNVRFDVATPSTLNGTAFWTTIVKTEKVGPTPRPARNIHNEQAGAVVWLWMFIAGLGVGTTFSVPTIVIQNAVPFKELGVATSNLTFFRQIGGTIALAFVGTIFATSLQDNLIPQMSAAGVPQQVIDGFTQASSSGSFDFNSLTGVGTWGWPSWPHPASVPGGRPAVHRRP